MSSRRATPAVRAPHPPPGPPIPPSARGPRYPRGLSGTRKAMNDHTLRVYDSILGLLASAENPTPLVRLHRIVPYKHTQVYAKLEWYNPFGAVKDRIAANLLDDAERRGLVAPGAKKLVEPTSGNPTLHAA